MTPKLSCLMAKKEQRFSKKAWGIVGKNMMQNLRVDSSEILRIL